MGRSRYFSRADLAALFTLGNADASVTHQQLLQVHGAAMHHHSAAPPGLQQHLDDLLTLPGQCANLERQTE
jgi:hypothetical protein